MIRKDLRNIAIVAHVDHGKTTLVDEMLKFSGAYRENQVVLERVMDSNALERERGITILSKNTSMKYKDCKINVIDTPGHADFGGEVERILKMVDGVVLLVDAAEGPMPQTRFVTEKAFNLGLKVIIVINKIDKKDARLEEVPDEILELFLDLDATDEQIESPILFCSGREGTCSKSSKEKGKDLEPLFETILEHINPPSGDETKDLQLLVSSIDYNEYVGRIAIGRVENGKIKKGQEVSVCEFEGKTEPYKGKIVNLYEIGSFERNPIETATVGDIVCVSGIEDITIGNTICEKEKPNPLPFVKISEPTVEMTFSVNNSPFAGQEGKFVTSRQIKERLEKELLKDVSLKVSQGDSSEKFNVLGRGEMHLSILIETMRRENFEFLVPSRGLFGYRNEFLTDTKGEGIMNSIFDSYGPYKGEILTRTTGSLVSYETGEAITYGLYNAQNRGQLLISPGEKVYEGMVVGFGPKQEDIVVNVCKKKHLTNTRASGSDDALKLVPQVKFSLEQYIEFLAEDELLEVTPKNLRVRKAILNNQQRAKSSKK